MCTCLISAVDSMWRLQKIQTDLSHINSLERTENLHLCISTTYDLLTHLNQRLNVNIVTNNTDDE